MIEYLQGQPLTGSNTAKMRLTKRVGQTNLTSRSRTIRKKQSEDGTSSFAASNRSAIKKRRKKRIKTILKISGAVQNRNHGATMDQRGKELIASTNNSGMSRRPTIQTKANQTLHAAPMSTRYVRECKDDDVQRIQTTSR